MALRQRTEQLKCFGADACESLLQDVIKDVAHGNDYTNESSLPQ